MTSFGRNAIPTIWLLQKFQLMRNGSTIQLRGRKYLDIVTQGELGSHMVIFRLSLMFSDLLKPI